MLRPPEPCPWETACAECAERLSCSAWLDYSEQVGEILEEERSNLVREELARTRTEDIGRLCNTLMSPGRRVRRMPGIDRDPPM